MDNLDKIFTRVQEMEQDIQKAMGEKSVLTRQIEQHKESMSAKEKECREKWGCSPEDLEDKRASLEAQIKEMASELEEHIKILDSDN